MSATAHNAAQYKTIENYEKLQNWAQKNTINQLKTEPRNVLRMKWKHTSTAWTKMVCKGKKQKQFNTGCYKDMCLCVWPWHKSSYKLSLVLLLNRTDLTQVVWSWQHGTKLQQLQPSDSYHNRTKKGKAKIGCALALSFFALHRKNYGN